jgi:hypothetical protein
MGLPDMTIEHDKKVLLGPSNIISKGYIAAQE